MSTHFITGAELSAADLAGIIDTAIGYKNGSLKACAAGKILTLIFANPSLRTHLSFESGMKKLGGEVNILHSGTSWQFEYEDGAIMNGNKQEHIREAARVISQYTDIIGLRNSQLITTAGNHSATTSWEELKQDKAINQLARYATESVINMESNMFHPCQALADMMTMKERLGNVVKKKYVLTWVPHPKALPLATPHSQLLTPAIFGMDATVVHPEDFELDADVLKMAKNARVTHDQKAAFKNADVIVAKSWASLRHFGQWEGEAAYRKQFEDWIVNEEKMRLTNNALFLHCLPVRRNVEVTDGVLDSPQSCIIQEAGNRMWTQMALISYLLKHEYSH